MPARPEWKRSSGWAVKKSGASSEAPRDGVRQDFRNYADTARDSSGFLSVLLLPRGCHPPE